MTNAMKAALLELTTTNGEVGSQIIKDLIKDHETERDDLMTAYNEYRGEVPIKSREDVSNDDICNKLPHDYRGEIVDTFTGYLFGEAITYEVESEKEKDGDTQSKYINEFNKLNNIEDLDSETGKLCSICGKADRLLYTQEIAGKLVERAMNVPPWECIHIRDGSVEEDQYAMRYYRVYVNMEGAWKERWKVEWYDNLNITFWIEQADGNFVIDDQEVKNPLPHNFELIPLIEYVNNEEKQGDFEKVKALIDAFDRSVSYNQDELEAFRNAYLKVTGATIDKEAVEEAKNTRVLNVPEGGDIGFITKDIKDTFLENHLKRLEESIYRFSKCPNMSDEKFSGAAQSGESRKFKLIGLENKSKTKERKFTAASRNMFKVLATLTGKRGMAFDYLDITLQFTRNLPLELALYADVAAALKGTISMQTILSLMPFIDDVDAELKRIEEENVDPYENMDLNRGTEGENNERASNNQTTS